MQSQLDQFAKKAYPHILLLPVVEIIRLQSHLGVFLNFYLRSKDVYLNKTIFHRNITTKEWTKVMLYNF